MSDDRDEIETAEDAVQLYLRLRELHLWDDIRTAIEADRAAICLDERRKVLREAAALCDRRATLIDNRVAGLWHRETATILRLLADKEPER